MELAGGGERAPPRPGTESKLRGSARGLCQLSDNCQPVPGGVARIAPGFSTGPGITFWTWQLVVALSGGSPVRREYCPVPQDARAAAKLFLGAQHPGAGSVLQVTTG